MTKRPLEGIRVLDFTWVRAGPWATRWLSVMGAEVIKVEWPDPRLAFTGRTGSLGDASAGPNSNGHFNDQNAEKRSITVNVRSPKGLQVIKDLLRSTDIVIENFSAGVLRDWGLSFDEMRAIKPDIIYVSMAGFGQTGPHAHYTTFGPSAQALSGLTFLSGLPDAPPAGWGWSYMDDTGGMHGAIGALTALHHRRATAEGQHVDLSQVGTGMTLTGPALLDLSANGRGSRRAGYPPGNRTHWPGTELLNNYRGRHAAPHNAYRTLGDGHHDWAVIACFSDGEWRDLVGVMGSPAWAADPKFDTLRGRLAHQAELDEGIAAWAAGLEKYELADRCQAAGVRAAPVQSNQDRVEHDPQLRHRGMFTPLAHPVIGEHPMQQAPFKFSATPVPITAGGPLLGADNVPILGGMLGMSWEEIAAGYEDGTLWPAGQPVERYLLEPPEQMPPPHEEQPLPPVTVEHRYSDGALGDLRVIEIGGEIGQWCAKLMADQGADVIKIEPPSGAAEREIGPFYHDAPDTERSLHFWHYNTSKRGVTLDITTEGGRELFRRLVATADVLIDSRPLGELDSLGLDYAALSAANPGLVMCSITPFGQDGPWTGWTTSDLIQLAAGGQMGECGYSEEDVSERTPIAPGGGNAWHIGSHFAYIAIMGAVFHRGVTGEGQFIDASVHDACALTTEGGVTTWIYGGQVRERQTGRHASPTPTPPSQYRCADGVYVNTLAFPLLMNPAGIRRLAEWFDTHGLAQDLLDERYADREVIAAKEQHVKDVLRDFIAALPSETVYHEGQGRGFSMGPVRAPEEVMADQHFHERGFFVEVEHPDIGRTLTYPGAQAVYSASPWRIQRRAPHVGEHNAEVYGELGLSPLELAALREGGAL